MGVEPQPVPPVYAPDLAAGAILHCAQHPTRDIIVGGMGAMLRLGNDFPRVADRYMEATTFDSQKTGNPVGDRPDNLYAPVAYDGGERGRNWTGRTKSTSLYTAARLHPGITAAAAAVGIGMIAAGLIERRRGEAPSLSLAPAATSDSALGATAIS
jgi:hypothetical protein